MWGKHALRAVAGGLAADVGWHCGVVGRRAPSRSQAWQVSVASFTAMPPHVTWLACASDDNLLQVLRLACSGCWCAFWVLVRILGAGPSSCCATVSTQKAFSVQPLGALTAMPASRGVIIHHDDIIHPTDRERA